MERVEKKYLCSDYDILVLKQRLALLLKPDPHQKGEEYVVRSVYFDTPEDRCYYENEDGVDKRKKYRIRTYLDNEDVVKFEIKSKQCGKTSKEVCLLERDGCEKILKKQRSGNKEIDFLIQSERLCPKIIVDYERTAYVYPVGNVRITFDRNISVSTQCSNFLSENLWKIPVLPPHQHIMEVKYDELLPDTIAEILDLGNLQQTTFSKYYIGRQMTDKR